jgi:hypothetical protein
MKHLILYLCIALTLISQKKLELNWYRIDSLELIGQFKSANKQLDQLKKLSTQDLPLQIKYHLYKIKYIKKLNNKSIKLVYNYLISEISKTQSPLKNILHSILAEELLVSGQGYYNNKSLIPDTNDIETWNRERYLSQAETHYFKSLENLNLLQIDLKKINSILIGHLDSKLFRPTLFDLLAHRQLDFYDKIHNTIYNEKLKPENYFIPTENFLKLKLKRTHNYLNNALVTYQKILHANVNNETPYLHTELRRLSFLYEINRDNYKLYHQSLNLLVQKYPNHKFINKIIFQLSQVTYEHNQLGSKNKTLEILKIILSQGENALFYNESLSLKNEILLEKLEMKFEEINIPNKPFLGYISYQNIDSITFYITPYTSTIHSKMNSNDFYENSNFYQELNYIDTLKYKLHDFKDHESHSQLISLPKLNIGKYLIVASSNDSLDKTVSRNIITISNLSYTYHVYEDQIEIEVRDRATGMYIENTLIKIYEHDYDDDKWTRNHYGNYRTNEYGKVSVKKNKIQLSFDIINNNDTIIHNSREYLNEGYSRKFKQVYLYSDRAIYRPEQTIFFKGIILESDEKNKPELLKNENITVTIKDKNYKTIHEQKYKSNSYGSFSDSFRLPSGTPNGNIIIQTNVQSNNNLYIKLEEYKRPKFEIIFEPINYAYAAEDSLEIKGQLISYSGVNLKETNLTYEIYSEQTTEHYSSRYYRSNNKEILFSGKVSTNMNGYFSIDFKSKALLNNFMRSYYRVVVKATDVTGETYEQEKNISVYKEAFNLSTNITEYLNRENDNDYSLSVKNSDGYALNSSGILNIIKLETPNRIIKSSLFPIADTTLIPFEKFVEDFPHSIYKPDDINRISWFRNEPTKKIKIDTNYTKIDLKDLSTGQYLFQYLGKTKNGTVVKYDDYVTLFSTESNKTASLVPNYSSISKKSASVHENLTLSFASSYEKVYYKVEIFQGNMSLETKHYIINNEQKNLKIKIKESYQGGFAIVVSAVIDSRTYNETFNINVPWINDDLKIKLYTKRKKLYPGEKEKWELGLSNSDKNSVKGEILASMYDASLDKFSYNNWDIWQAPTFWLYNYQEDLSFKVSWSKKTLYQPSFYRSINYRELKSKYDNFLKFNTSYIQSIHNKGFNNNKATYNIGGIVRDAFTDEPLPGVNVLIKGSKKGASTDVDGFFVILNKEKLRSVVLEFKYVGYRRLNLLIELPIQSEMNIYLEEETNVGDVVVVVAKRALIRKEETNSRQINIRGGRSNETVFAGDEVLDEVFIEDSEIDLNNSNKSNLRGKIYHTRSNFAETVFFKPHLNTETNENASISFTVPDALTRWKFMALGHDEQGNNAYLEKYFISQKELMVEANAPRFIRVGDSIQFTIKVTNLTEKEVKADVKGNVILTRDSKDNDEIANYTKTIEIAANKSVSLSWPVKIDRNQSLLKYHISAETNNHYDAEENTIPVLMNKVLVTNSELIWADSAQVKTYALDTIIKENKHQTLRSLTIEYTDDPIWTIVESLPFLIEYPYDCSEQIFSRYFANKMAKYIIDKYPNVKSYINEKLVNKSIESQLKKNNEFKSILLRESPWLLDAENDEERFNKLSQLFNEDKIENNLMKERNKLKSNKLGRSGWSWFNGMKVDMNITLHIMLGFAKLKEYKLLDKEDKEMIDDVIYYLDSYFNQKYFALLNNKKINIEKNHLNSYVIKYLYLRTILTNKIMGKHKISYQFWLNQIKEYWLHSNLKLRAMIALILKHHDESELSILVFKSIKELEKNSPELGIYWEINGYGWDNDKIELQTMMIKLYKEMDQPITNLTKWLIKHKQTNAWFSTKSTSSAIYTLLKNSSNQINSDKMTNIKIASTNYEILKGQSSFKKTFSPTEIDIVDKVVISKASSTVSWGTINTQYLTDISHVNSFKSGLEIEKKMYKKVIGKNKISQEKINNNTILNTGDVVTVQLKIKSDRDINYIHLKDLRSAGLEPVDVISRYKYQNDLGYYQETKDSSSHFFISLLKKGIYVIEYQLRANLAGKYSNGYGLIESMYVPEFRARSGSESITIQND